MPSIKTALALFCTFIFCLSTTFAQRPAAPVQYFSPRPVTIGTFDPVTGNPVPNVPVTLVETGANRTINSNASGWAVFDNCDPNRSNRFFFAGDAQHVYSATEVGSPAQQDDQLLAYLWVARRSDFWATPVVSHAQGGIYLLTGSAKGLLNHQPVVASFELSCPPNMVSEDYYLMVRPRSSYEMIPNGLSFSEGIPNQFQIELWSADGSHRLDNNPLLQPLTIRMSRWMLPPPLHDRIELQGSGIRTFNYNTLAWEETQIPWNLLPDGRVEFALNHLSAWTWYHNVRSGFAGFLNIFGSNSSPGGGSGSGGTTGGTGGGTGGPTTGGGGITVTRLGGSTRPPETPPVVSVGVTYSCTPITPIPVNCEGRTIGGFDYSQMKGHQVSLSAQFTAKFQEEASAGLSGLSALVAELEVKTGLSFQWQIGGQVTAQRETNLTWSLPPNTLIFAPCYTGTVTVNAVDANYGITIRGVPLGLSFTKDVQYGYELTYNPNCPGCGSPPPGAPTTVTLTPSCSPGTPGTTTNH